jgi:hypothetical protein
MQCSREKWRFEYTLFIKRIEIELEYIIYQKHIEDL